MYQLSFKNKFPKAVGFGVDDAADCVTQFGTNTAAPAGADVPLHGRSFAFPLF